MLSKRLKTIAEMIDNNKVVFDVGSDHALLPCFLIQQGITQKAYAGEIAKGPLNNAKDNIERFRLKDKVIPVLSDGLMNAPDDVETVVISGMGYYTIEHILDNCDINKYDSLIVQSNTDVDKLRAYLSDHNLTIIDEQIVYDGFFYQVIKFNSDFHDPYSETEIEYGPVLLKRRDDIFLEYLNDLKDRYQKIYEKSHIESIYKKIVEIDKIMYNK